MRKEKVREGSGGRNAGGGGSGGEREEMVGHRLVQHLKKKRHTWKKDVKYVSETDRERGRAGRER